MCSVVECPHMDQSLLLDPSRQCSMIGMCCSVFEMVHIKEPLLLIKNSNPSSGSSRFPISLSEWPFTISLMPYNHK